MNDFRKEGTLCDVIINVRGGRKFAAHCTVLAASSHYFRKLFSFNSRQSDHHFEVDLEWLHPEAIGEILDYMYTGQIQLGDNAEFILTAASYFFIESLQEVVTDFLQEHLEPFQLLLYSLCGRRTFVAGVKIILYSFHQRQFRASFCHSVVSRLTEDASGGGHLDQ